MVKIVCSMSYFILWFISDYRNIVRYSNTRRSWHCPIILIASKRFNYFHALSLGQFVNELQEVFTIFQEIICNLWVDDRVKYIYWDPSCNMFLTSQGQPQDQFPQRMYINDFPLHLIKFLPLFFNILVRNSFSFSIKIHLNYFDVFQTFFFTRVVTKHPPNHQT